MKTLGIDIDGVLANQINGIIPIIKEKTGISIEYKDVNHWKLKLGDTNIAVIICEEQESNKEYVINMPSHKNAKSIMHQLKQSFNLALVTARPINTNGWSKEWLSKNEIPYDSYYNTKEGGKQDAAEKFDLLIDDYEGNIIKYLERDTNHKAILFSQPWNHDRKNLNTFFNQDRLKVVSSWLEVPEVINELLNTQSLLPHR